MFLYAGFHTEFFSGGGVGGLGSNNYSSPPNVLAVKINSVLIYSNKSSLAIHIPFIYHFNYFAGTIDYWGGGEGRIPGHPPPPPPPLYEPWYECGFVYVYLHVCVCMCVCVCVKNNGISLRWPTKILSCTHSNTVMLK